MIEGPLKVFWRDRLVGTVANAAYSDFPWIGADFVALPMEPRIREALEWIDRESRIEDSAYQDPPFAEELLDDWSIEMPDGEIVGISFPVVDFETGKVEWR